MEDFKLTDDIEEGIRDTFEVFDVRGSGQISANDLEGVMKKTGWIVPREEVEEMISLVDTSGEGIISYKDFRELQINRQKELTICPETSEGFMVFDVTGKGYLTIPELIVHLEKCDGVDQNERDFIIKLLDPRKRGVVSFESFADYMAFYEPVKL